MPKLNETFVKKASLPEAGQKVYYDSAHPGFGLRVTKGGTKAFILNYHINKRERRFTIGKFPAWSAAAAREKASDLRRLIDQGIDPLDERNERRDAPTVSDLWIEYEKVHFPTLSPRSIFLSLPKGSSAASTGSSNGVENQKLFGLIMAQNISVASC